MTQSNKNYALTSIGLLSFSFLLLVISKMKSNSDKLNSNLKTLSLLFLFASVAILSSIFLLNENENENENYEINPKKNIEEDKKDKNKAILISAVSWCAHCKRASESIDDIKKELKKNNIDIEIIEDTDKDKFEIAKNEYNVNAFPYTALLKNDKKFEEVTGFAGKDKYVMSIIEKFK